MYLSKIFISFSRIPILQIKNLCYFLLGSISKQLFNFGSIPALLVWDIFNNLLIQFTKSGRFWMFVNNFWGSLFMCRISQKMVSQFFLLIKKGSKVRRHRVPQKIYKNVCRNFVQKWSATSRYKFPRSIVKNFQKFCNWFVLNCTTHTASG